MSLDGSWILLDELFVDTKVDSVPYNGGETAVPGLANSCAGDGVIESNEAAEQKGYLWYE